jgi:hypothetical protein
MIASPVITWVGGICWVPIAVRTIESTTEIFTKLVTIISAKGARPSAASATISTNGRLVIESVSNGLFDSVSSGFGIAALANASAGVQIVASVNSHSVSRSLGVKRLMNCLPALEALVRRDA